MSIPAEAAAIRAQPEWQRVMNEAAPEDGEPQAVLVTMFGAHVAKAAAARGTYENAGTRGAA